MRLRENYEKPAGWSPGQPEVLVADSTVERLGMAVVDYDSLHRLLTDDIGIPYDARTVVKFYGGYKDEYSKRGGHYKPGSHTLYVNAPQAERQNEITGNMGFLAHEARHYSNYKQHAGMYKLAFGARAAMVGAEVGLSLEFLPLEYAGLALLGEATVTGVASWALQKRFGRRDELQAQLEENNLSTFNHATDILFPHSYRIPRLIDAGRIQAQTLEALTDLGYTPTSAEEYGKAF